MKVIEVDLIDKVLHYIGKTISNPFLVQIGAMDGESFDDVVSSIKLYDWDGLYVEPIPYYFNKLIKNKKDTDLFEQSAIVDKDGLVEMITLDPITIQTTLIETHGENAIGYSGMSAVYPPKNGFGTYDSDVEVADTYGKIIKVNGITLNTLFEKHNVQSFDMFLCDAEGLDWEVFSQLDLSKYRPKLIRVEHINLSEQDIKNIIDKLETHNYTFEISGQDIDATPSEFWEEYLNFNINEMDEVKQNDVMNISVDDLTTLIRKLIREEMGTNSESSLNDTALKEEVTDNLTVVTGLWDIGREGRSFEQYLENFDKFLQLPVNMFIYIPKELEDFVWNRRDKKNTHIRIFELDNVRQLYDPFWDKTQEIRTSESWLLQTGEHGWLKDSPQAKNEWYNPIVQSKMFMLNDAKIINPFDTDYLIWLDAGITNTVYENYFTKDRCLDKITQHLDSFLFLSYPYQSAGEIHGFNYDAINTYAKDNVNYVCRGGLFGGHKDYISNANATYYSTLLQTLSDGYMGTEESIFTVMSYLEPHIYKRYELDDNGLIVKFVEDLVNDSVNLVVNRPKGYGIPKKLYNKNKDKTSLYVLGFNFPEQFKTLLESFENHPEWLERPRKILINNSDDQSAIEEYEKLCKEYNFEHIITGENLGINRGRLYAAKHFDESDSDYYFFFEDDMCLHSPENVGVCRNGFRQYIPNLYEKVHEIIARENFDFLKLSYTEVYMDNNIQVSWYNVPSETRDEIWPDYNVLPIAGIDPHSPRTTFNNIGVYNELSYIDGEIYYANWPMIVSREGNKKMFLEVEWEYPYEQTWMSHMFQETIKGNLHPAVLLASPINHNRIKYYKPEQRKEN